MAGFNLRRERIVSFRDELLPPCWIATQDVQQPPLPALVGSGIWQTEASGGLLAHVVRSVRSAREMVCVASFLLADPDIIQALLEASDRGLRVYVLTASERLLLREPRGDGEFEKERLEEHKRTLDRLAGKVLVRTAPSLHTKFLLIDPKGPSPGGILFTCNLTREALTRNPELAVELSPDLVGDLFRQFLVGFWRESDHELLEPGRLRTVKPGPPRDLPAPKVAMCTMKGVQTLKSAILQLLNRKAVEVLISTFGIDSKHEVTDRLLRLAKEGRKVAVLVRPRPANMEAVLALAEAGAEIRAHPWLHAKAVLVDGPSGAEGIVATANFQTLGLDEGFESGVVLRLEQARVLGRVLRHWWTTSPLTIKPNEKRGQVKGEAILWKDGRLQRASILERFEPELGVFEASSFEAMERFQPPSFPEPPASEVNALYHEHVYRWTVTPPRLPGGATKAPGDHPLPVFRKGNETYVAIRTEDQLEQGQHLANELGAQVVWSG